MKIKLPQRVIALILIFTIAFLSFPLVKAEVVISLEENEETNEITSGLASASEIAQTRGTYTISYWYSDGSYVGVWSYAPYIYYCQISGSSYFNTAIQNATTKWRNALSVPIYSISTNDIEQIPPYSEVYSDKSIVFYQGNNEEIYDLNMFDYNDVMNTSINGLSSLKEYSLDHYFNTSSGNYRGYTYYKVRGFIRDFGSNTTKYNAVSAHEIGHALGWRGHSNSISDVMYSTYYGVVNISDREANHLKQIYDIFY